MRGSESLLIHGKRRLHFAIIPSLSFSELVTQPGKSWMGSPTGKLVCRHRIWRDVSWQTLRTPWCRRLQVPLLLVTFSITAPTCRARVLGIPGIVRYQSRARRRIASTVSVKNQRRCPRSRHERELILEFLLHHRNIGALHLVWTSIREVAPLVTFETRACLNPTTRSASSHCLRSTLRGATRN